MIKFFRRIRQSLLTKNKFSTYLLYAIGEIILVVIGILIAIQINNWNGNIKDRAKEMFFLQKLTSNLNEDIISLKNIIRRDSLIINDLRKLSEEILTVQSTDSITFDNKSKFIYIIFSPNTSVYENLTSSGQIGLISNDTIIDKLILFYKEIEMINDGPDASLKNYSREIESFYTSFDHLGNINILPKRKIEDYRNTPFVLNSLYFKTDLLYFQISNYTNLLADIASILEIINLEIDKLKKAQ